MHSTDAAPRDPHDAAHSHRAPDDAPPNAPGERAPPTAPDLSFPFQTTDVLRTGMTNEYREVSKSGVVPAATAFYRAPSRLAREPTLDKEKQRRLAHVNLVVFKPDDPEDPRTWANWYRWVITGLVAFSVVCVAFGSAVITGDFQDLQGEFHIGEVVAALTVSLMVCGFALGPAIWGPCSELFGRRPIWIISFWLYTIMNILCALAPNIGALLAGRFLCGLFASSALVIAGGTISDLWDNNERGFAIALFAAAPYGGPVLGPIVGGFVGENIGWRWIIWVNMIFAGVVSACLSFMPETFAPVILRRRARKLREETGHDNYATEQELFPRPFSDLLPIMLLMSLYIAMIYGLLYAFFFAFPVVFGEGYGWNNGLVGLSFCPILIGVALALFVTPRLEGRYAAQAARKGGRADPEDRLPGMMLGAPFIPISLFIFAWTSPPVVLPGPGTWVGPCMAGIPFGFGMTALYFAANAYLIDTFSASVASALSAKTLVRSGAGAAMPLFITAMFHRLGNQWAGTLLAFLSVAILPIPYVFYFYGARIRAGSKLAAAA
ncbi:MFS general substrate transporter [Vararia minispora EC-137]|uniref:MFS general substrate transporter n=1 Tax=Vararia minispora EC-137 TaxID=1314806 RepID=A0ACB8QP44_9AGAM|nr:MFS general substrate transporter [Vararia minispora EC-137]